MSKMDAWRSAKTTVDLVESAVGMLSLERASDADQPQKPQVYFRGRQTSGLSTFMGFALYHAVLPNADNPIGNYLAKAIEISLPQLLEMARAHAIADAAKAGSEAIAEARDFLDAGEVRTFLEQGGMLKKEDPDAD